ncbi:MAG: hypothetical protein JW929_08885 [Anaerolineales bacterium]|nr:hypothetical protein [Anaerolineales bacterium]
MAVTPFVPGLILALAAWILPPALRLFPPRFFSAAAARAPWLPAWAPWICNIGPAYLGLLLGWISTRDYGITGHTPAEWILGAAAAILLGILLGRISNRLKYGLGWGVVGDEARWTLYRAAAWPLVAHLPLAVAAALTAAGAEFAFVRKLEGGPVFDSIGLLFLAHAGCSAVLFLLTHNFFLAMLFYLTAVVASQPDICSRVAGTAARIRKQ